MDKSSPAITEAEKKPPLPSIGSTADKTVKAKKETENKRTRHPTKKADDVENQMEKESTTASSTSKSLKKSKKKKGAHEWNRYFAFIKDKDREKLMKLPEIEKSKFKLKPRSKSAKKIITHTENDHNKRIRSKSVDFSEEVKTDNKAMTSTPKQVDSKTKESPDLERMPKLRKKKTSSILGNFNFNIDLDESDKRKKPANIGYNYYRSQSSKRMQCKPQLIDEFDEFTLADEFNTLRFRTSQNNIMRSMRANL